MSEWPAPEVTTGLAERPPPEEDHMKMNGTAAVGNRGWDAWGAWDAGAAGDPALPNGEKPASPPEAIDTAKTRTYACQSSYFSGTVQPFDKSSSYEAPILCVEAGTIWGTDTTFKVPVSCVPGQAHTHTCLCFKLLDEDKIEIDGKAQYLAPGMHGASFVGRIRQITANRTTGEMTGFISCAAMWELYKADVYVHKSMLIGLETGDVVVFKVHVNAKHQPQAQNGSVKKIASAQPHVLNAGGFDATANTLGRTVRLEEPVGAPSRVREQQQPAVPEHQGAWQDWDNWNEWNAGGAWSTNDWQGQPEGHADARDVADNAQGNWAQAQAQVRAAVRQAHEVPIPDDDDDDPWEEAAAKPAEKPAGRPATNAFRFQ